MTKLSDHTSGRTDRQMDRQMSGQAKNIRALPTCWRGPKYILGHTSVLINDKQVFFCECQYLYILKQIITITLTFMKTLDYRFHGSRTTLKNYKLSIHVK